VQQEKALFPVAASCRVLGVSPSGYYAWCERPPSARAQADERLLEQIRAIHAQSRGTYGARRIRIELRARGIHCARKRIARLMRQAGLAGAQRRRYRGTTRQNRAAIAAPDLVQRDFTALGPNQLWVADVTYVPTGEGWLYLATVLDAWSRRIVGWAMGDTLRTELVVEALDMAVWNRRPAAGVVHHSDRGAQYTGITFSRRCAEAGVVPSTGSVGDAYDNALAEAFFATLETELLMRQKFATRATARLALFDFIEGFYNSHRRHSALGYLSPAEFERQWLQRPDVHQECVWEETLSAAGG
jgi:transposase InsO family protein